MLIQSESESEEWKWDFSMLSKYSVRVSPECILAYIHVHPWVQSEWGEAIWDSCMLRFPAFALYPTTGGSCVTSDWQTCTKIGFLRKPIPLGIKYNLSLKLNICTPLCYHHSLPDWMKFQTELSLFSMNEAICVFQFLLLFTSISMLLSMTYQVLIWIIGKDWVVKIENRHRTRQSRCVETLQNFSPWQFRHGSTCMELQLGVIQAHWVFVTFIPRILH